MCSQSGNIVGSALTAHTYASVHKISNCQHRYLQRLSERGKITKAIATVQIWTHLKGIYERAF